MLAHMKIRSQMTCLTASIFILFGIALFAAINGIDRTAGRFEAFVEHDEPELLAYFEMYAQVLQEIRVIVGDYRTTAAATS